MTRREMRDAAERPVPVTATVRAETLLRFDDCAQRIGLSRETALQEAVRDWMLARERSHNRQDRLALQKALQEAKNRAPVEDLLDRFRAQMQASKEGRRLGLGKRDSVVRRESCGEGLTNDAGSANNAGMSTKTEERTLRQRREALGLSRERLARLADISTSAVAQFEEGRRPKKSDALPILEKTLAKQEQVAA